jgi:hypothetical protein
LTSLDQAARLYLVSPTNRRTDKTMAHGDITRMEYKVTIRTSLGNLRTEWRGTEAEVAADRAKFDVVDVEYTTHVLDF